jgi:hypothetical protein
MRVHLSKQVLNAIYALREEGIAIRAAIEHIRRNPDQPDAIATPDRPGRRELFVRVGMRGYWIGYEVDRTGGETVIVVGSIEENL